MLNFRIENRSNFGRRDRPFSATFWDMSKNKSDSKWGVLPRIGVWSLGSEIFRPPEIALDTQSCPRVLERMGEGTDVILGRFVTLVSSRACGISRISIRSPFEPRTDFPYRAIRGCSVVKYSDRTEFRICRSTRCHDRVGFDGLRIGVPDTPKSRTRGLGFGF